MTTNMRRVKDSTEIRLNGIVVKAEFHDKSLQALTLIDADGRTLKIVPEYATLKVLVDSEPETKQVFLLKGKVPVLGTDIAEPFEDRYQAAQRQRDLEASSVIENAEIVEAEVEIPF